jgi:hypothetical protein
MKALPYHNVCDMREKENVLSMTESHRSGESRLWKKPLTAAVNRCATQNQPRGAES